MAKAKPHETDDHLGKEIEIKCQGADLVSIDDLIGLQGNLKTLSDDGYERLKSSILELGFSFPIAAWKDRNKTVILDAHQRVGTLKRMREEGYVIPKLPVVWVEAADKNEAAKKVLAATSQYGEVSVDGLHTFMENFKLDMTDMKEFKFPEIDFESFEMTFFPDPEVLNRHVEPGSHYTPSVIVRPGPGSPEGTEVLQAEPGASTAPIERQSPPKFDAQAQWGGMPEFKQEDKGPFRSMIIHFFDQKGVDDFAKLINQSFTDKTKMTWFPQMIIEKAADKAYGNFES